MKYAYFSASLGSQVNAKSLETSFTAGVFDETTGSPLASASRTVNPNPSYNVGKNKRFANLYNNFKLLSSNVFRRGWKSK